MTHKAGYVNIIGRPNVGKSTLMNHWVGEKLSIISPKAQTTRHRILGIVNDDEHQVVFSDTPGIIFDPANKLHITMNAAVDESLEDADVVVFISEVGEKPETLAPILEKLQKINTPKILLLNKVDVSNQEEATEKLQAWQATEMFEACYPISALQGLGTAAPLQFIFSKLPENPPYFPKDQLTDRSERFFVSEIIREKIFHNYQKEIPYSIQVEIDEFKEQPEINKIRAIIYAERESQKAILIGNKGEALKKIGIEARKDIEILVGKKVFLELFVKVKDKWRNDTQTLKRFGY
jgi:GTP-binding protein Era